MTKRAAQLVLGGLTTVMLSTGMATDAHATTFTETVPNGNGAIPSTYPPVGGTMFVLIGDNGNIYYQFVNPSTQFQGFAGTGDPAAFRGIPTFQLGPTQALNCGTVTCSEYFGGGISEGYARLTVRDADACPGNFDYQDVSFQVNGLPVSSLSDLAPNSVQRTNLTGTTQVSNTENCFRNQGTTETSTAWFDLAPNVLDNIFSTGSTTPFIRDEDTGSSTTRGDNAWFFRDGVDATGTPEVAPGITIEKTADRTEYSAVGDIINYSFLVTNIGSVRLTNVVVDDSFITGAVSCPLTALNSGQTMTCSGQHSVTQANIDDDVVFVNTANVTATPTEGTLGNVSGTLSIPGPDSDNSMTLTKTASKTTAVDAGDTITYTYVVQNTGNITLDDVTITDVHAGIGTLSAITPAERDDLGPNQSQTFTATYVVQQGDLDAGPTIDNTATASATPKRGTVANVSADETITLVAPNPAATFAKLASPGSDAEEGDLITYTYTVANTGNVTIDASVSDVQSGSGTLSAITPATATLAPGDSQDFTATYTVTQADFDAGAPITNTATADLSPTRGTLTNPTADASVTLGEPAPLAVLTKTASDDTDLQAGQTITYTYSVANTGDVTLTALSISDVHGGQGSLGTISPSNLASLAPGDTQDFTATYTVTQADVDAGTPITNTATLSATPARGTLAAVTADESVTIEAADPQATLSKTASDMTDVVAGQIITYTYRLTNTGNVRLSDASITDVHAGTGTLGAISPASVAVIEPGDFAEFTAEYEITQADVDAGAPITNTATATATPARGTLIPPTADESVAVSAASPALSLAKTASSDADLAEGDVVTYSYVVRNSGNTTITDVSVSDAHGGSGALGAITPASVAILLPGDDATFTAEYTITQADVDAGTPVSNTATATGTPARGTLSDPTATESVTVEAPAPAMTLAKTASDTTDVAVGDVITYSYRVTNTGNVSLSGVSVTDAHNGTGTLGAISPSSVASLAVGDFVEFTADYTVTQADIDAGTAITNTATVSATPARGTLDPVNDSESVSVEDPQPASTLTKTADKTAGVVVDDVITYSYTLTNTGNVALNNVGVSDVHSGTGALSAITPANVATIAPGDSATFTATYTITQADIDAGTPITNTATASATPAGGTFTPPTADETVTPRAAEPLATLVKTASPDSDLAEGDVVTYSYVVTNAGNVSLSALSVSDVHNGAGTLSAITPATVSDLGVGQSTTFTATYTVTQADVDAGTPITNTATLSATPARGTLPAATDDASAQTEGPSPALTITKRALDNDFTAVNDVLSYEYVVANTGNVTVSDLSISDDKIASVSCPVTVLAPGETTTCTADYSVTQADLDFGSVVNNATATGTPARGTLVPPTDTVTVSGTQSPELSITKRALDTTFAAVNDTLRYEFDVENTGNVEIAALTVTDDRIASVTCPVTTLAPGASTTCSGTDTVTQADLDAGSVTNVATANGTPAGGTLAPVTDTQTVSADQSPALSLTKTARAASFSAVNEIVTYDFVVTNTGNVTITSAISVDDDRVQPPRAVQCDALPAGGLAPNATLSCTMDYAITQADLDAGSVVNTARATDGTTTSPDATATTSADQMPALTLAKAARETEYTAVDDVLTYDYTVSNTGNVSIADLAVTDDRIDTVVCAVTAQGNGDAALDPGETVVCTATDTVTQADLDAGSVVNNATASGTPAGGTLAPATGTETVDATQTPALTIVKTALDASYAAVGDELDYSFVISNSGNVAISALNVSDDRIGAVSCDVAGQGNGDAVLDPTETVTCLATDTVTQADIDAGDVTNIVTATGTPAGGTLDAATDTATVDADQNPAMSVLKTATDVNFELPGDVTTYEYVVTNTGNTTLTDPITVSDNLIANVSCPALPAGGLAPAATLTCSAQYTATQADIDAGQVTNLASANSGALSSPQTSETIPADQSPALSVIKEALTTTFAAPGDVVTYRFTLSNDGNVTLTGTTEVVDDKIGTIECFIGNFTPGSTQVCEADYSVTQADIDNGSVTNQAFAQKDTLVSAPVSETVDATVSPALDFAKRAVDTSFAAAGDTLRFAFDLTNSGNVTLSAISVSDPLIPSLSCPTTTLAPGATATCTGEYTLTQADVDAGTVTNTATAMATPPGGTPLDQTASATVTGNPQTDVSFAKRAVSTNFANAGDVLSFAFDVANIGTTTLSNIAIDDPLAGTVACPTTTLAPGQSTVCTADYTVTQADVDAGNVENTATLSADGPDGTAVPSQTDTASVDGTRTPALAIAKTSPQSDFSAVGDTLSYEFAVTNTGNVVVTNIVVSDDRIATVNCPVTTLAPGASTTCTGTDTVTQSDLDAGSVTNVATVSATPPAGTTLAPVTDTLTIDANQTRSLDIAKTAAQSDYDSVGDVIDYRYVITNTGNVTITDAVTVNDDRIASISCPALPAGGLLPGAQLTCSASDIITQADLDAGSVTNTASATDGTTTSPEVSETVTADSQPSLSMTKTADPQVFDTLGQTVSYAYVITNTGNVSLTDALAVSDNRITVSCPALPAGGLAPNAQITCTGTDTVSQDDLDAGRIENTATATSGTTQSSPVTEVATADPQPALDIVKRALSAGFAAAGERIDYAYDVTNTGNVTITDAVSVSDDRIASVSCPALPSGRLAPGAVLTCSASYTVTQADVDAGSVTNLASASIPGTSSPTVSETVDAMQAPALDIVKTALQTQFDTVGDVLSYRYDVRNTGNVTLSGAIDVSDDRIASVTCPALPMAGLAPNAMISCTATYLVTQADLDAGFVTNTATASNGSTVSDPDMATVSADQGPALNIVKRALTQTFDTPGDVVSYEFDVTNTGNVTLTDPVTVADDKIASVSCPALPNGQLLPGESVTCAADYIVTQTDIDAGLVTNVASATSGTVVSPTVEKRVFATRMSSLEIDKRATTINFNLPGDIVTYQYTVTNSGNVTITNPITVADNRIPSVVCPALPAGGLAPGADLVCMADFVVTQDNLDVGVVTNIATATDGTVTSAPDSETIPANANPALEVRKSSMTPDYATVGETITYRFEIENTGNVTLTNTVQVIDNKIGAIDCFTGNLVPGQIEVCTADYTVTQADIDAGSLTNDAYAEHPRASSPPVFVTIPAVQMPALDVVKTARSASFDSVGDVLDYAFVVTNTGNVTLRLPVEITDSRINDVRCPALPANGLAPNATLTCTGSDTVAQADIDSGQVVNLATARSGNTVSTQVSETVDADQNPALDMVKTARSNDFATVGDVLDYSYTITNTGNVTVTDALSISDDRIGTIACPALPAGGLVPNATLTCTASDTVTQADLDAGSVTNIATATDGTTTTPPATATIDGTQEPALSLAKTALDTSYAAVGDELRYEYVLTNTGNVTLTDAVSVSDDRIAEVTCPALPAGGLPPSATLTCTASDTVTQADIDAGSVTNTAMGRSGTIETAPVSETVNAATAPALSLEKRALDTQFDAAGDQLSYEYIVTNAGNVTVTQAITVSDDRIANVTCPALPSGGLLPGAQITCTGTDTVTQADVDAGTVTNTASATDGTTTSPTESATVNGDRAPAYTVDKRALSSTFTAVGDTLSYEYIVRNTGNVTLTDAVAITDDRIADVTCPALPGGGLVPGATLSCFGEDVVTQADLDAGTVTNIATAQVGTQTPSAPDTVSVTATQEPSLTIAKSANATALTEAGQIVTYSYVVTNTGNVTLTDPVTVSDDKIATVVCPAELIAPTETLTCAADYTVTQMDLDAGFVTNIATASSGDTVSSPDSVTIETEAAPGLSIVKRATTESFVQVGDIVSYAYDVTNTGNQTLTERVSVTDDKIDTVVCPTTLLAPSESLTCTADYAVTQADIDAGSVTNLASADSGDAGSPEVSETVTADRMPRLSLQKTVASSVQVGGPIYDLTYDLVLENTGNVTLTGLSLIDDLRTTLAPAVIYADPTTTADGPLTGTLNAGYDGAATTELFDGSGALAVGERATVTLTVRVDATIAGPAQGNTAFANAAELSSPVPSNDPSVTPGSGDDLQPTPHPLEDRDGDGAPDIFESFEEDRDGDGIPDALDYDPTGYFYCEENGGILSGGRIAVNGPAGRNSAIGTLNNIVIVEDGTDGFYQFYVTEPGEYELELTYPTTGNVSTARLPETEVLDATSLLPANPAVIGSTEVADTNRLADAGLPANPRFYTRFAFEAGDPSVLANNIPLRDCGVPGLTTTKSVVSGPELDADGRQLLTYALRVENTGETQLNGVSLIDNLQETFGPDRVSLMNLRMTDDSSSNAKIDTRYDGATFAETLDSTSSLAPGDSVTVELDIAVSPDRAGDFVNTVNATALTPLDGSPITASADASVELVPLSDASQLTVTKTAQPRTVQIGDPVLYRIEVTNDSGSTMTDLRITDRLPQGFAFVPGSARVSDGGEPVVSEPLVQSRGVLSWDIALGEDAPLDTLDPGETLAVSLRLLAGPNVEFGAHENQAFAESLRDGSRSEIATAVVDYIPEPSFDCTPVLGRVYDDVNQNGYPDDGEPGLPGVRLATVNGDIITTDEFGRYHIPCASIPDAERGSNFLLKLDDRTLPLAYNVTTENPRVVRATRGKFVKMNFGAAHRPLVRVDLFAADLENGRIRTDAAERAASVLLQARAERADMERALIVYHAEEGELVESAQGKLQVALAMVRDLDGGLTDIALQADWGTHRPADIAPYGTEDGERFVQAGQVFDTDGEQPRPGNRDRIRFGEGEDGRVTRMEPIDGPRGDRSTRLAEDGFGLRQDGDDPVFDGPSVGRRSTGPDASTRPNRLQRWLDWGNATTPYADAMEVETTVSALDTLKRLNAQANVVSDGEGGARIIHAEGYWNYDAYVTRAELRLFEAKSSTRGEPLATATFADGQARLPIIDGVLPRDLSYVLRVYGIDGQGFDETAPKSLDLGEAEFDLTPAEWEGERFTAFGHSTLLVDRLRTPGGTVRVYGRNVSSDTVQVMGQTVRVDEAGRFVAEQILPSGEQSVTIEASDGYRIMRSVDVSARDTFFVAQVEATIGQNIARDADGDRSYEDGRVAFYVRSKLNDRWAVTATADTGEAGLGNLLNGLDDKDVNSLLRRLDPDRYYPTYGDESTIEQDAPTSGRVYARIERDDDYLLWGNYQTQFTDTEFGRVRRTLYGAKLRWDGGGAPTALGDERTELTAFIAEGGSRQGRDVLRGTGGSVYYLRHGDIAIGSEIVRVETRDSVSGLVLESRRLTYGTDYDLDFIQGRVLLTQPLGSTTDDGRLFRDGNQSGNESVLVVDYEYTPVFGASDDAAVYGARVSRWLGDSFKLGATYNHDTDGGAESDLYGIDATLQFAPRSYVKAEYARTEGLGVQAFRSNDGGFTYAAQDRGGVAGQNSADGLALEAAVNFDDFAAIGWDGTTYAYYRNRDAGFAGYSEATDQAIEQFGGGMDIGLSEGLRLKARADITDEQTVGSRSYAEASVEAAVNERVTLRGGVAFSDDSRGNSGTSIGGRVDYKLDDSNSLYAFGQLGLEGDNTRTTDRIGAGAEVRLSKNVLGGGEISTGEDGLGARASLRFEHEDGDESYLAYDLPLNSQLAANLGTLNVGTRQRYGDALSIYGEERFQFADQGLHGLTHAYGIDYSPGNWSFGVSAEIGTVDQFDRESFAGKASWRNERMSAGVSAEWREDENIETGDERRTWLLRSTARYEASDELKLQGKFNLAKSDQSRPDAQLGPQSFNNAEFIEASIAAAYRPIWDDRFNLLAKLVWLDDLSPTSQRFGGQTLDYRQKSMIASVDGSYDVTPRWTLGGKYAYRSGEVTSSRDQLDFTKSEADLLIARLDYHATSKWDATVELRHLDIGSGIITRDGGLAGLYRHVGDNAKIGAGLTWGGVEEQYLSAREEDAVGWFFNVVGKF